MPQKSSRSRSPSEIRLDELFKTTEKQLDLLQKETQKRLDNIIEGLVNGDITEIKSEIRKAIEASQKRQLDKDLLSLQRSLTSLAGIGSLPGKSIVGTFQQSESFSEQIIQNFSLNQYALNLQQLIQKSLRNL